MRVIHLATVDLSIRFLLLDQLLFLKQRGHDVHAVCSPGQWVTEIEKRGIPVHTVPMTRSISPGADLSALLRLDAVFARVRPHVVHTHTPKASLLGQYAALRRRVPARVHTIHGLYQPAGASPCVQRAYLGLERITMAPAHAVLSQSAEDVETCKRLHLCDARKLTYLGNGIDITRFQPPSSDERAAARQRLGIAKDALVIGTVGRLVREKGFADLFAALPSVFAAFPQATVLVVGARDVEKPDALTETEIGIAATDPRVRFLGQRQDMPEIYQAMDLLAHPSHREGVPRSPMEAAASGVVVIATDIRGCREVVESAKNGELVPPRDPSALGHAIIRLLSRPERRAEMAGVARRIALDRFDQRRVFELVAATYDRLGAGWP